MFERYEINQVPVIIKGLNLTREPWTLEHVARRCGHHVVALKTRSRRSARSWGRLEAAEEIELGEFIATHRSNATRQRYYLHDWSLPSGCPEIFGNPPFDSFTVPRYRHIQHMFAHMPNTPACTHACTYVCTHVHTCLTLCLHTCLHTCLHACLHICLHTCLHTCLYACLHTCLYACLHACLHICLHTCLQTCLHTCLYAGLHACRCTCLHACLCTRLCTYLYTCLCPSLHTCLSSTTHVYQHISYGNIVVIITNMSHMPVVYDPCLPTY